MKVSEITAILAQAGLPALTRGQLLELASAKAGKRFGTALRAFASGDAARRDELEATVLTLDFRLRTTLLQIGCETGIDQLIAHACTEQRRFFDAISAIDAGGQRAASARHYLASLGLCCTGNIVPKSDPAVPPYYSFKIFAKSAALCISEAQTRTRQQHTVQIEAALALGDGAGLAFDWANKITVQLTVQEAYQTLALFENKLRLLKFDGHGRTHDKSLQLEWQDSHYFVRLIQRGRSAIAVPVRSVDAIPIISLLYKQILMNEPHLNISHIQTMTDRLAAMAGKDKPERRQ